MLEIDCGVIIAVEACVLLSTPPLPILTIDIHYCLSGFTAKECDIQSKNILVLHLKIDGEKHHFTQNLSLSPSQAFAFIKLSCLYFPPSKKRFLAFEMF